MALGTAAQQVPKQSVITTDYLLYLPKEYDRDTARRFPVVVFLHGAGESGTDIQQVTVHGIPMHIARGDQFPFIAVSPQCRKGSMVGWETVYLNKMLDDVMAEYRVDPDRVYLTGISMGGFGTFRWACENPERFAAIIPISGGGETAKAWKIRDIPTWVFHGAKDNIVSCKYSTDMVEALRAAGSDPKFTVYPEAAHSDCWQQAYETPELYEWMLSQKRIVAPDLETDPLELAKYTGAYLLGRDTLRISTQDGKLELWFPGNPQAIRLKCDGTDRFYIWQPQYNMIRFRKTGDGTVDAMETYGLTGEDIPAVASKLQ